MLAAPCMHAPQPASLRIPPQVRSLREDEQRAAVDEGVRLALEEAHGRYEAAMQHEVRRAAQEAFEKGKAAITRSADRAMLAAAHQRALDEARGEVAAELAAAVAAAAHSKSEYEKLEQSIGELA